MKPTVLYVGTDIVIETQLHFSSVGSTIYKGLERTSRSIAVTIDYMPEGL